MTCQQSRTLAHAVGHWSNRTAECLSGSLGPILRGRFKCLCVCLLYEATDKLIMSVTSCCSLKEMLLVWLHVLTSPFVRLPMLLKTECSYYTRMFPSSKSTHTMCIMGSCVFGMKEPYHLHGLDNFESSSISHINPLEHYQWFTWDLQIQHHLVSENENSRYLQLIGYLIKYTRRAR